MKVKKSSMDLRKERVRLIKVGIQVLMTLLNKKYQEKAKTVSIDDVDMESMDIETNIFIDPKNLMKTKYMVIMHILSVILRLSGFSLERGRTRMYE